MTIRSSLTFVFGCTSEKLLPATDFQPKYLFYLVNKIPKWIFGVNSSPSARSPLKVKLFLLIISENIHRTKKIVKQKMKLIKSFTNKVLYMFYLTSIFFLLSSLLSKNCFHKSQ